MKTLLLLLAVFYTPTSYAATRTYGLHLFFNEKEFVDVLTIQDKFAHFGEPIGGTMHVPNDFDGEIIDGVIRENKITFDLLVPKNSARPEDLLFHYEGTFFDKKREQIIGFVTIKNQPGFVASFVAFLRGTK